MDYVLTIVLAIAIVIYPRKNVFIDKFKLKALGLHIEISAKEKNCPPLRKTVLIKRKNNLLIS